MLLRCSRFLFGKADLSLASQWAVRWNTYKGRWSRGIRTSPPLHIAPWILGAPVARLAVAVAGRLARRWWRKLRKDQKAEIVKHAYDRKERILLMCLGGTGLLISYYAWHVEEAPITGRRRFIWLSEQTLAEASATEFEEEMKVYLEEKQLLDPSHDYHKLVHSVTERLVTANTYREVQKIDWKLYVVNKNEVNAKTYPTGEIIVYTGLLAHLNSLDELAVIVGHEMSHAVLRHSQERLSVASFVDSVALIPIALIWFIIPLDFIAYFMHAASRQLVKLALHLPYSRKLETEADVVGLLFAARACYDPSAAPQLWKQLHESTTKSKEEEEAKSLIQYFSTHPPHEQRSRVLTELQPVAMELWENSQCGQLRIAQKQFGEATGRWKQKLFRE